MANGDGVRPSAVWLSGFLGAAVGVLITYVTAVSTHGEEIRVLTERVDNLATVVEFRFNLDSKQIDEALNHARGGAKTGHAD